MTAESRSWGAIRELVAQWRQQARTNRLIANNFGDCDRLALPPRWEAVGQEKCADELERVLAAPPAETEPGR